MGKNVVETNVSLPAIHEFTQPMLQALADHLNIDRGVLASEDQVQIAWDNLPRLLTAIPAERRDEGMMRMCVAVAAGLFDAAVNYVWNAAVVELRGKIRRFGINSIPQILDKEFDEEKLMELRDAELLNLCLKLNLISESGHFMLNQCREIRNNFSAAHPAVGKLDEYEFIAFLNRCGQHALREDHNTTGVDIKALIVTLNASGFSEEQYQHWNEQIANTFDAQRLTIFVMLHGLYCDPAKEEHARINAVTIAKYFSGEFSPQDKSALINQHDRYRRDGKAERIKASRIFFRDIGQIALLSKSERHSIVSSACKNLIGAHKAMDNFYNEPPFAEKLAQLAIGHQVPESVRHEFVESVVTCAVGNEWGTSHAADPFYKRIIVGMSPKEIEILLSLPASESLVGWRIEKVKRCKRKFKQQVALINSESVPTSCKPAYEAWMKFDI